MRRIKGTLEIDSDRGVIYFTANPHPLPSSRTRRRAWLRMRICQLPKPIPDDVDFIEVTVGYGANYDRLVS